MLCGLVIFQRLISSITVDQYRLVHRVRCNGCGKGSFLKQFKLISLHFDVAQRRGIFQAQQGGYILGIQEFVAIEPSLWSLKVQLLLRKHQGL